MQLLINNWAVEHEVCKWDKVKLNKFSFNIETYREIQMKGQNDAKRSSMIIHAGGTWNLLENISTAFWFSSVRPGKIWGHSYRQHKENLCQTAAVVKTDKQTNIQANKEVVECSWKEMKNMKKTHIYVCQGNSLLWNTTCIIIVSWERY